MIETETELEALIDELQPLIKGKARHASHLHELPTARGDQGGMKFCPGCRAIILSRRLANLLDAMDDSVKPPHKEKSRRDEVMDYLKERREIEA